MQTRTLSTPPALGFYIPPCGFDEAVGQRVDLDVVRPGAQQLASSVLSDLPRHLAAQLAQFRNLMGGDAGAVEAHRRLYGELRSVMDVPAEVYLDTICRVFRAHELPLGRMTWRGRLVRLDAIHDTALLAVEGERDETCPPGQTRVALELCSGLEPGKKRHHLQPGAGHDALFEGPVWEAEIYPLVREVIRSSP